MKRPAPRQMALFAVLGLSVAATVWVASHDESDTVTPPPRRAAVAATATATATAKATPTPTAPDWPSPAPASRTAWPEADPEARRAWGDATPAPFVAVAAPATPHAAEADPDAEPPAPPFPYQLVGRMTDSRPRVVLNGAQRSLVLGVGEVVDGQWRIEAIEANGLRLKHLPAGPSKFIAFSPA